MIFLIYFINQITNYNIFKKNHLIYFREFKHFDTLKIDENKERIIR